MTDIPSWAVPGAKVVCVNDWFPDEGVEATYEGAGPAIGHDYTVRGNDYFYGMCWIAITAVPGDVFFPIVNFRPAVEPKTEQEDVALFKRDVEAMTPVDRLDRLRELMDV